MKKLPVLLMLCLMLAGCGQKVEKPVQTDPPVPIPERIIPETEVPTEAPTETPTEAPTEATEPADAELVLVTDYIPEVRVELAYASEDNFTGQTIYEFSEAYLRYGTVKKLKLAAKNCAAGPGTADLGRISPSGGSAEAVGYLPGPGVRIQPGHREPEPLPGQCGGCDPGGFADWGTAGYAHGF